MKFEPDQIEIEFICENCNKKEITPFYGLLEGGTPLCFCRNDYGDDMTPNTIFATVQKGKEE